MCNVCLFDQVHQSDKLRLYSIKQLSADIEELIHLLQMKRQFIDMAIDSLNTLMKKKANLDVKEISDTFT